MKRENIISKKAITFLYPEDISFISWNHFVYSSSIARIGMENSTSFISMVNVSHPSPYFDFSGVSKLPYTISIAGATFMINMVQICVFFSMKKRSFSNVLFLSLAISDFMFAVFQVPLFTINQIYWTWPLGTVMCYVNILYFGVNFSSSNYLLMILAIHRLLQIVQPFRGHEKVTKKKIAVLFMPLAFNLGGNCIMLIHQISNGKFNYTNCSLQVETYFVVLQLLVFSGTPITITLLINLFNIGLLFKMNSHSSRIMALNALQKSTRINRIQILN